MKSIVSVGLLTASMMMGTVGITYGAPIISSSVMQDGGTIQIQGSGFGAHANFGNGQKFLNRAWHNMESGDISNFKPRNPLGGNFEIQDAVENWRIVSTGNRPNSKYHIEKWYNPNLNFRGGYLGLTQTGNPTQWYYTFWFKLLPNTQSGKFTRIWGSGNDIYLCTGGQNTYIRCGSSAFGSTQWTTPDMIGSDIWHRIEIWINESNHEYTLWMDGKKQFTHYDWLPGPLGGDGHTWEVGGMIDGPAQGSGSGGAYCYDDVFFDHTQARVELGNAPTWQSSTVREIQIPNSWSDNSISIMLNKGAFSSGSTAYLFIVDSAGNVSNGYPISLDGSDTGVINSPQNLRIVM